METLAVGERMRKRIRDSRYQQDRKDACLICRRDFATCQHSWYEVDKVCRAVRDFDSGTLQVKFV